MKMKHRKGSNENEAQEGRDKTNQAQRNAEKPKERIVDA
jgi:hypothetical protein